MGVGRRGSGGGRNVDVLKQRVEACRRKYPTVDDTVSHLREQFPLYRRMKFKELTRLVGQMLEPSSPPRKKTRRPSDFVALVSDGEEEEEGGVNRRHRLGNKRVEESEARLLRIEEEYARRGSAARGSSNSSSSESDSEMGPSSSAVSTSEDAVYEGKVEPEFDITKSMLRKSYSGGQGAGSNEKNVELEVATDDKEMSKVGMVVGGGKGKEVKVKGRVSGSGSGSGSGSIVDEGKEKLKDGPWFRDLGGMENVLKELEMEVLVPLYHPNVPKLLGVKPIRGILLHGPPGCGKTKLAHAIANETGVSFYKISAPEVVSGVSGASEENIRELFGKAYRTAPAIIYIDEIDAIAAKRDNLQKEMERRIVTQLMTCMDEYQKVVQPSALNANSDISDERSGFVLVIAATNRPDAIDPALRRPGRFDREIGLGIPDENARIQILSVLARDCKLEGSVDLLQIARSTPGFVGADLDALVNKAGNLAIVRIFHERMSKLSQEFDDGQSNSWLKEPLSPVEIEKLAIVMADFEEAIKLVQPSSRREGFSSIPNVKWDDVGGLYSVRHEFDLHVVRRIKFPEVYQHFGVNMETGILLFGPPGCGKTLIAQAVANEAGANFIHVKGPELLSKYVGESELAVRTLFGRARACSPCVIFFDEVDALTIRRGEDGGEVAGRVLTQLLTELDGVDLRRGVVVIGATNRPEVMDPAILRPGRFGKRLYVPLPSPDDRGLILKALAKGKPVDPSVDLCAIGRMEECENFSGADLKELMNQAATAAATEATAEEGSAWSSSTIKKSHFLQVQAKISPSVSCEVINHYKLWSESFKPT